MWPDGGRCFRLADGSTNEKKRRRKNEFRKHSPKRLHRQKQEKSVDCRTLKLSHSLSVNSLTDGMNSFIQSCIVHNQSFTIRWPSSEIDWLWAREHWSTDVSNGIIKTQISISEMNRRKNLFDVWAPRICNF